MQLSLIKKLLKKSLKLRLATQNYPSRGQTAIQDLYQTSKGKFFLKKSSKQNHIDCQIDIEAGTLAEREYWAYRLAKALGLEVPSLWLLESHTTIQIWLDYPDGRQYATSQGKLILKPENVFDCALFDWLTGQVDRHDANYLYDYVRQKIILIDSAHCFLKYSGSIPGYLKYYEIGYSSELKKSRKTQVWSNLDSLSGKRILNLAPLKSTEEQLALKNRLQQVQRIDSIQGIIDLYRQEGVRK